MKFSVSDGPAIIRFPLVPLIDILFLSLMFFVLNLKVVSPESRFTASLPGGPPSSTTFSAATPPIIRVGLRSDRDGRLVQLTIGSNKLGNDEAAFERLSREILRIIGRPGHPLASDIEIELDADFETQHKDVVRAISVCTGRFDPQTQQVARFVEKIKFAPPHKPKV